MKNQKEFKDYSPQYRMVKKKRCPVGSRKSKSGKTCRKTKSKKKSVKKSKKGWGRSYGY